MDIASTDITPELARPLVHFITS